MTAPHWPHWRWFTPGLIVSLVACAASPLTVITGLGYDQEIDTWRRSRKEALLAPEGWLTLVGLAWLEEGENPAGSAPENRVVLPKSRAPANAGKFVVADGQAAFLSAVGLEILFDGKPNPPRSLKTDAGGKPTTIELGSLRFYVIERAGRLGVRIRDLESPLLAGFPGLEYYPAASSWKIDARYEPYPEPKPIEIPNIMGTVFNEQSLERLFSRSTVKPTAWTQWTTDQTGCSFSRTKPTEAPPTLEDASCRLTCPRKPPRSSSISTRPTTHPASLPRTQRVRCRHPSIEFEPL